MNSGEFVFDWSKEELYEVYKLFLFDEQNGRLLGIEQAAAKALIDKYLEDEE
ncbi:MAG: hypothetical protein GVY26_15210 [Bacteroidetes bacterium]|jgi:hypothetical protein|nr:hypothetical protein [Bacteroidota bacterium]